MRLWKMVNGEPYMVNDPRLGILSLNPKKGKGGMARHKGWSARHMAWVRSFQRKRRRNPYAVAGPVMGLNPKRRRKGYRRKSNPARSRAVTRARGFFGLPPVMPVVYGAGGFVAVAGLEGVVTGFLPAEWVVDPATSKPNLLTKYGVLLASLVGATWISKAVFGPGPAALAGIGGGIYVVSQAAHDFIPGRVPGMEGLGAYTQIRAYRQMRQAAQIGAPDFGAQNTAASAPGGGGNIVQARFRRFQ